MDWDTVTHWYGNTELLVGVVFSLFVMLGAVAFALHWHDPANRERALARKQQRRKIADKFSEGLDDLLLNGTLTAKERVHWNKKLGYALDLPDLIPRRKHPEVAVIKRGIIKRLRRMGVNVWDKLNMMQKRRPLDRKNPIKPKMRAA